MVDREDALELHRKNPGKIEVDSTVEINDREDLNLVYTPGVAEPCKEIDQDEKDVYEYTSKGNMVGIVSDGSAVLGLGDIGPEASMPVMEGKADLMKEFGDIDGFPICLETEEPEEIIETVRRIAPTLGAVNLEDISAPECFEVEDRLKQELDIPVFHDDQHGTAIVVKAALENAFSLVGKQLEDSKITIIGAGASGFATAEFLDRSGTGEIVVVDSDGIVTIDSDSPYKRRLARELDLGEEGGSLEDALEEADAMIGLSTGGIVSQKMVRSMSEDPVIFALANPEPEITPSQADVAGAAITATGRSDFDNQVNNSLAFPGVLRGALDVRASEINHEMKEAASEAIADFIEPEKDTIVPETLDREMAEQVAEKVREAAHSTGVSEE